MTLRRVHQLVHVEIEEEREADGLVVGVARGAGFEGSKDVADAVEFRHGCFLLPPAEFEQVGVVRDFVVVPLCAGLFAGSRPRFIHYDDGLAGELKVGDPGEGGFLQCPQSSNPCGNRNACELLLATTVHCRLHERRIEDQDSGSSAVDGAHILDCLLS